MKLTQENFDKLVEGLNHRMTKLEVHVKWLKRVIFYMAGLATINSFKPLL